MASNNTNNGDNEMNALTAKITSQTTEQLKEIAAALTNDYRKEADVVFSHVLRVLETRLPEADFCEFCETL